MTRFRPLASSQLRRHHGVAWGPEPSLRGVPVLPGSGPGSPGELGGTEKAVPTSPHFGVWELGGQAGAWGAMGQARVGFSMDSTGQAAGPTQG